MACGEIVSTVVEASEVRLGLAELTRRCTGSYFASTAPAYEVVVSMVQEEHGRALAFWQAPYS
jgi:hypothetical protein